MTATVIQWQTRAGLAAVAVLLALGALLWIQAGADNPARVLGCVWDRSTDTTAPRCAP